jgi:ABC-2 type transport system ATP-binding protein
MDSAISTKDLVVVFPSHRGEVRVLDRLTLDIPAGQVFGFLGPNGAGKTTTMHVLLGFIMATSGEASIFGTDVRHSIARQRIGYLPEHPDTYRFLSGLELLEMTGRLFRLRGQQLRNRIQEVLAITGIENAADRRIAVYSRGMMQRICLAQALINDPDLVILDEPTGGLDPLGRMEFRKIVMDLKARGKTVFFSSHELSEVELVCDHLAILANGRMVAEGKSSDLIKPGESLEKYFMQILTR